MPKSDVDDLIDRMTEADEEASCAAMYAKRNCPIHAVEMAAKRARVRADYEKIQADRACASIVAKFYTPSPTAVENRQPDDIRIAAE